MSTENQNTSAKVAGGSKKRNQHSKLDDLTIAWMLYEPATKDHPQRGICNPNAPITRLMAARGHSRYRVLLDEMLVPPPIVNGGMWITVKHQEDFSCTYWDSFHGLPPMHGQFGPRKGRKQRMREAISKLG